MIREIAKGLLGFTALFFCLALLLTSIGHAEDYRIDIPLIVSSGGCGE